MAVTYSISRAGLEIYTTEAVKNPISNNASSNSDGEASNNFTLQTGDITNINYIGELYSYSFEGDYSDISSNASISVPIKYLNSLYKGQRVSFKKGGNNSTPVTKWEDMSTVVSGFVSEITWNREKADIKINGMNVLLDVEKKFSFKKTKRSKIIEEIIKASGLKAKVDVTGLVDDVCDFTNISSSGSNETSGSNSDLAGGEGKTIDELVAKIVGSETNELKKAELVHQWLKENVRYAGYSCSRYHSAEECLKHKHAINCADTARLTRAMMASAGLNCYVVHRTYDGGHFWVIIEIGGKKYASDQTGSGSAFNTVWKRSGRTTVSDGGKYSRKNGKNPDC